MFVQRYMSKMSLLVLVSMDVYSGCSIKQPHTASIFNREDSGNTEYLDGSSLDSNPIDLSSGRFDLSVPFFPTPITWTLAYKQAPPDNPLKGFVPYDNGSKSFPHSLEWFYLPMSDLQTDFDKFNWTSLDNKLSGIAGRGHQAIFRIYLDYPNKPNGMPSFLSSVSRNSYTDWDNGKIATSYSPDYENADLRRAIHSFITALGARYDGDPRIGFLTIGILGYWGEWHTYPHDSWMAPTTVMTEVLDAFQAAFSRTHLLAREPKPGVTMDRSHLGFHDDSFAYQTLGPTNWYFWPKIASAMLTNVWRDRCIGGEVIPTIQSCMWDSPSCVPAGQEYDSCVDSTHASWLLNQRTFDGLSGTSLDRALAGARRLGYEFNIETASIGSMRVGSGLDVSIQIRNTGVAPFYYKWAIELGALNSSGMVTSWPTSWDLRSIAPGMSSMKWQYTQASHGLAAGNYVLLLRVSNPMLGGQPIRFANVNQDKHLSGWMTIGEFTVSP